MKQQQQEELGSFKHAFNFLCLLASTAAAFFTPMTRRHPGIESPGIRGLFAFLVIGYATLATRDPFMMGYTAMWLACLVCQRINALRQARKGGTHSRYGGRPYLFTWLVQKESTARALEMGCCFFAGVFAVAVSKTLSGFLIAGACGLWFTEMIDRYRNHLQMQRTRDAHIEMTAFQEQLKGKEF